MRENDVILVANRCNKDDTALLDAPVYYIRNNPKPPDDAKITIIGETKFTVNDTIYASCFH